MPDDRLLGGREGNYRVILESSSENRVGVAASALGIARGAFDEAVRYANERLVRGRPIIGFQAVAHRLADMAAGIEAARWLVYHGAWCVDRGTLTNAHAAKVKVIASETAVRVTENAIRIHGAPGSCASIRSAGITATRSSTSSERGRATSNET